MTTLGLAGCLIGALEGCRQTAYWDSHGKVWTIGRGHTKGVVRGQTATMAQVEAWMAEDFAPLLALVEGRPVLEAGALVSFGYNCGEGALRRFLAGEIVVRDGRFMVGDQPYGELAGGARILLPRRRLEAALIELGREGA